MLGIRLGAAHLRGGSPPSRWLRSCEWSHRLGVYARWLPAPLPSVRWVESPARTGETGTTCSFATFLLNGYRSGVHLLLNRYRKRFGVQSRISPHWTRHSLGHILYAQPNPRRDERGISSLLLSMPSYATTDAPSVSRVNRGSFHANHALCAGSGIGLGVGSAGTAGWLRVMLAAALAPRVDIASHHGVGCMGHVLLLCGG